jgi:DNA-binding XRE family transcriptional regulator
MRNEEFGYLVREARQSRKIGLRKFALQVGVDYRELSKVEREEKAPSLEVRSRLIAVLGIAPRRIADVQPPFSDAKLAAFNERVRFRPKGDRPTSVRYRAGMAQYECMRKLEWKLPPWTKSFLRRVVCDSGLEAYALVQWLAAGAQPVRSRPYRQGLRIHAVVDPATRLLVNQHRFPALVLGQLLIIPQVSLLAGNRQVYTCDALVKHDGRWFDFEIDGKGHSTDRDLDRGRDLLIPIVRVDEAFVDSDDYPQRFKMLFRPNGLHQGRAVE